MRYTKSPEKNVAAIIAILVAHAINVLTVILMYKVVDTSWKHSNTSFVMFSKGYKNVTFAWNG